MTSVLEKIADLGARAVPNYDLIGFPHVSLERVNFDDLWGAVEERFKGSEREIKRLVKERGVSKRLVSDKTDAVLLLQERLGAAQALWRFLPLDGSLISLKKEVSDEDAIRWLLVDWGRIVGSFWYSIWVKSAEPAHETKKKLKRKITYYADDGTAFENRVAAKKHDTDLKRKQRIEKCLRDILPDMSEPSLEAVVAAMVKHPAALSEALSARAAVRASPKSAERKLTKRT